MPGRRAISRQSAESRRASSSSWSCPSLKGPLPRSKVFVLVRQRGGRCVGQLELVLRDGARVDGHLGRLERRRLDKGEVGVADELAREPEEGLLEVVVGLGGDVV